MRDLLKYGHILFDDMAIRLIGIFTESRPVGKWEGEVGREVVQIIGEVRSGCVWGCVDRIIYFYFFLLTSP